MPTTRDSPSKQWQLAHIKGIDLVIAESPQSPIGSQCLPSKTIRRQANCLARFCIQIRSNLQASEDGQITQYGVCSDVARTKTKGLLPAGGPIGVCCAKHIGPRPSEWD